MINGATWKRTLANYRNVQLYVVWRATFGNEQDNRRVLSGFEGPSGWLWPLSHERIDPVCLSRPITVGNFDFLPVMSFLCVICWQVLSPTDIILIKLTVLRNNEDLALTSSFCVFEHLLHTILPSVTLINYLVQTLVYCYFPSFEHFERYRDVTLSLEALPHSFLLLTQIQQKPVRSTKVFITTRTESKFIFMKQ